MRTKAVTLKQLVQNNTACYAEYMMLSQEKHFDVFKGGEICTVVNQLHKSVFYKISLILGSGVLHIGDQRIEITGNSLIFYNPELAYRWESLQQDTGYFCYFDHHFISNSMSEASFKESALFDIQLNPLYLLSDEQTCDLVFLFEKMLKESASAYQQKYLVLTHYLLLVIYEAHQYLQDKTNKSVVTAATRITSLFLAELEQQFPVIPAEKHLELKQAGDFAEKLAIHVNYLNKAIKEVCGKSTSELIAARVANEARSLLQQGDYSLAEIAYSLGFEHTSNFNTFFRKHMNIAPGAFKAK